MDVQTPKPPSFDDQLDAFCARHANGPPRICPRFTLMANVAMDLDGTAAYRAFVRDEFLYLRDCASE